MTIAWLLGVALLALLHGQLLVRAPPDTAFGILYWVPMGAIGAFMLSSGVLALRSMRVWWRLALVLWASVSIAYVSAPTPYGLSLTLGLVMLAGLCGILVVGGSLAKERWHTSRTASALGSAAAFVGWWPLFASALRRTTLSGYSASYALGATITWLEQLTALLALASVLNVAAGVTWLLRRGGTAGKAGAA